MPRVAAVGLGLWQLGRLDHGPRVRTSRRAGNRRRWARCVGDPDLQPAVCVHVPGLRVGIDRVTLAQGWRRGFALPLLTVGYAWRRGTTPRRALPGRRTRPGQHRRVPRCPSRSFQPRPRQHFMNSCITSGGTQSSCACSIDGIPGALQVCRTSWPWTHARSRATACPWNWCTLLPRATPRRHSESAGGFVPLKPVLFYTSGVSEPDVFHTRRPGTEQLCRPDQGEQWQMPRCRQASPGVTPITRRPCARLSTTTPTTTAGCGHAGRQDDGRGRQGQLRRRPARRLTPGPASRRSSTGRARRAGARRSDRGRSLFVRRLLGAANTLADQCFRGLRAHDSPG